ncbi:MAG: hypothetical protein CVV45_12055 [Spirochaetae bacterium HGW-Spirochaetae-10]|jgi:hypothetical protein|nr:MAG: hypothetical protein CVV45_12055 [Spirochaetae bacterium HGW-Spirochaetae-10]
MRAALLIFILAGLVACVQKQEENQHIGLVANLYTVAADTALIDRAEQGMTAWQIGLNTGFRARYRNAGGAAGTYDPPHWVAISPRNCAVMGAPGDMRLSCPLANTSVVGVCQIINDSLTGEILNTTTLIARDYQVNEAETLANRLSIFTHEFGHCLGLQHSASTGDVMYADTSGADVPSAGELSVIQYAYTVFQDPPDTSRFFTSNGKVMRHFKTPAFFLYDETNYQASALTVPPAPPVNPVEVHNILIFADGSEIYYRSW